MDVFEAIETRRSIRKYLDVPVEWDKVGIILEAGRLAPSAGNVQEWRFVVVTNPDARKEIAASALSQEWIAKAPIHIVIVGLIDKIKMHYGMRGERLYSIQDCAVCATHMMLAAHALGLATCWIGAFDESKVQRTLGLPDNARPQMILTLGYPDEKPKMPPRYPIDNLVFLERFGNIGRIKDIGVVLWDHNVVGRTIKTVKDAASDAEKLSRGERKKIFEKMKESYTALSERLKKKQGHKYLK